MPVAILTFFANMQTEFAVARLDPEDRTNAVRAIDMRAHRGKRSDREHQARSS